MSSNKPSGTGFPADRLRLLAWEHWIATLRKIEQVDSDILSLACTEAYRQYEEMQQGLVNVILDAWPIEIVKRWAIWQALAQATVNAMMGVSLFAGTDRFAENLEQFVKEQTSFATDQPDS
jgi:hypothetical protein